ncbi:hypothetical protein T08_375 [Trichinella sp. T8]|nr:hypothetical protein T08_375 [Trichinella sp. T8]
MPHIALFIYARVNFSACFSQLNSQPLQAFAIYSKSRFSGGSEKWLLVEGSVESVCSGLVVMTKEICREFHKLCDPD